MADIDVTGLGDAEASRMIAAGDVYKTPNAVYTSLIGEDRVTRLALLLTRDVLCNNQLIMECVNGCYHGYYDSLIQPGILLVLLIVS